MGIHGQATSQLSFVITATVSDIILGEERQGMKIMFQMMNFALMGCCSGHGKRISSIHARCNIHKNRYQGADVTQMLTRCTACNNKQTP
jgi:Holliday junction resolvasome RuvABC ATP-dependent DNA helicase subunit